MFFCEVILQFVERSVDGGGVMQFRDLTADEPLALRHATASCSSVFTSLSGDS